MRFCSLRTSSRSFSAKITAAALLVLAAQPTWGWGREGHRLTALVAEHYLTPAAQAQVKELLGTDTLDGVAPWADDYRSTHPETGKWHYVDIPKEQEKYDRTRDCPASEADPKSPWRDCVTDRTLYFEGQLGDESLPKDQRAMALKFLVHLIGDIHQPFHALGDDRGGNNINVHFLGSDQCGSYKCNLHGVWDDAIIEHRGLSEEKYTALLLQEIQDNHWENMGGGTPSKWAEISHHYAVEAYAPNGAMLTHDYVDAENRVVDAELALGGLRLAHVLNRIFATTEQDTARSPTPSGK